MPFAATFIGEANLVPAEIVSAGAGEAVVRFGGASATARVRCPGDLVPSPGHEVTVAFRPEHLDPTDGAAHFRGAIESSHYVGTAQRYLLRCGDIRVRMAVAPELPPPSAEVGALLRDGCGVVLADGLLRAAEETPTAAAIGSAPISARGRAT